MRRTFAITAIALFMFSLDRTVVLTALPQIRADLGAGLEGLQWTLNAYTLTFAVLVVTGAALGALAVTAAAGSLVALALARPRTLPTPVPAPARP